MPSIGIRALATYVPPNKRSAKEISVLTKGIWTEEAVKEKLGINQISIPGPDDGVQEMGAKAAFACLNKAEIDAMELDAIICIGDELREYPMTTSGIYIQHRIGAKNAWAVDVMQKCSSFAAGIRLAKALLIAESQTKKVLLCGGYRNGDAIDYTNPRVSFMYNLAAGGGAAIIEKDINKNLILGTSLITDGELSRHVLSPVGGTAQPLTIDNINRARLDVIDQEGMRRLLAERSHPNFIKVITDSLSEGGYSVSELDYLAVLHMKRSAHYSLLKELGLSKNQSVYLEDYGHIGQFDQILSLELAEKQGQLKDGDLVSAVGAGIGYSWGAVAIRWGENV